MSELTDRAAGAFVWITAEIKRWEGIARLKRGSEQAAIDAGADPSVFRGYVNLLGRHHAKLKYVKSLYMKVYTFLYENTLPYGRGAYMILAVRYPEISTKLQKLIDAADAERDSFLLEYDRLREIARQHDMGRWIKELDKAYPSVEQVRRSFGCYISPPSTLDGRDIRTLPIPLDVIEDVVESKVSILEDTLEQARQAALKVAKKQLDVLCKQLGSGKKLYASLVTNTERVVVMLREMSLGYMPDPRLITVADELDTHIAKQSIKDIKDNPVMRRKAHNVAVKAQRAVKAVAGSASPATMLETNTPDKSGEPKAQLADTGMLADLIG